MTITYQNDTVASYSAGWTGQAQGGNYSGDEHFSNTAGSTCTWTFTGLTNGVTYWLGLAWRVSSANSAVTPWAAASGGNTASGTYSGKVAALASTTSTVPFQCLAAIVASGTTATLVITIPSGTDYAILDAACIGLPTDFTALAVVTGDWSTAGTWSPAAVPPSGVPVISSCALTVSDARSCGLSGFTTGGTPALKFGTGGSLTVSGTGSLVLSGDLLHTAASTVTISAGGSLAFKPPSGQQCVWNFTSGGNFNASLVSNGSSGSHATISTDKSLGGLASLMTAGGSFGSNGIVTASYTDFADFGTSSAVGLLTVMDATGNVATSITHCTFTRCSYSFSAPGNNAWDGNLTFQNNVFSSSVTLTLAGLSGSCAGFGLATNRTSGTRLVDTCGFDANIGNGAFRQTKFTNNVVIGRLTCLSSTAWPDDSYFAGNFHYAGGSGLFSAYGPVKDCYLYDTDSSNPHYLNIDSTVTAGTVTGCLFESGGTGGTGDCIFPPSGSGTLAVKNCIILPDASGKTSGKLVSCLNTGTVVVTVEHNTFYGTSGEHGLIGLDETASSYAGEIAACRANLVWSASSTTNNYVINSTGSGTPAVGAVTLSDYNATQNANTGTCFYNTSTSQGSVLGYKGIKIAANTAYPNATIGLHDIDVTSGGPSFVDSTRALATWGGTAAGGGVATVAGAIATLAANPALIGQASTGLLAWVRAGFRIQSSTLKAASYPTDASTADAAGNAWPGALPDIGAMAWLASSVSLNEASVTTAGTPGVAGIAINVYLGHA